MLRTMGTGPRRSGRAVALVALAAALAATLIAWVPGATPASAAPIGTTTSYGRVVDGPNGVATGPDDNIWFTSSTTNAIGRMTPTGVVNTFTGPGISGPRDITSGPDGAMWFTNTANSSIGRISMTGVVTNYPATPQINVPIEIVTGADGNLWFTNTGTGADDGSVGRITTSGVVDIFSSPTLTSSSAIAAGPDGNLWVTTTLEHTISRVTTAGVITTFSHPSIKYPSGITGASDGNLWFTNDRGVNGSVGRITTAGVVTDFPVAGTDRPQAITAGPDGNLWFTDFYNNSIVRITTAGVATVFPAFASKDLSAITTGPDGNLWFASYGTDWLGRMTTSGAVTNLNGTTINRPYGIARGADGNLWFANSNGSSIGRITPAGVVSSYTAAGVVRPYGITAGPDGNLWFTNYDGNTIGRITTAGVITTFPTVAGLDRPHGITAGPDGALWFTNTMSNRIGRITTAGVITIFPADATISAPHQITTGPDGALWFTNRSNASIGRITTAGVVSNFTGTGINGPYGITTGADGNLWFTNNYGNSIGKLTSAGAVSIFTAGWINNALPYDIAAGPDGNVWFTVFGNTSIGRITPGGVLTQFQNAQTKGPFGITAGGDGTMWFTNQGNYTIGKIVAANVAGAPTAVTGVPGNAQVAVTWSAPTDNGGSSITGYTVTSSPEGKVCTTMGALTCSVTGLTNGTAYTFKVVAINVAGTGPSSTSSAAVTPATVPGAPTGGSAVAGNAQAAVSWVAPASNGGSPISGYTVTSSPGAKTCTTTGALSCTVSGLTNGTAYTFTVRATNAIGAGAASAPSAAVTPSVGSTAPGAPTAVSAVAGKQRATVSWTAPASNGGSPITGYAVTATPGGASCSTTGALSCAVTGLTSGPSHTFTVRATNAIGQGPASAASSSVVPWDGSGYHAVTPERILDSRLANKGFAGPVVAPTARSLQVTGLGGASNVPATATAVVMNVTVADATNESFLTVYPTGTTKPNASNLNFGAGQVIPNLVTVKLGTGGKVDFANVVGATDVIADVVGYYDDGTGPGDLFTGITPVRLVDSRSATGAWDGPLPAGAPRDLVVRKPGNGLGVPATATAVVANVTVTGGTAQSFLSVWPSGVPQPGVSNLNMLPGQTIPNLVTVKIGTGGAIRIANAAGNVHVIVDVVGYFDPTSGSRFHAINPNRILDSRSNKGLSGPQGAGQTRALAVAGAAGSTIPAGATGLVANVTVADATAESFVAVFPGNVGRPNPFSNLNFAPGQVIPNLTAVGIAPNGTVNFYNHLGTTALIADAVGYYAPT